MLKRALLLVGGLALCCAFAFGDDDIQARLIRLETMMNLVLQRLGINPDTALTGPLEEVKQLLLRGKKIDAIKVYRQQTGADLKTAKNAVDEIERQMRGY